MEEAGLLRKARILKLVFGARSRVLEALYGLDEKIPEDEEVEWEDEIEKQHYHNIPS